MTKRACGSRRISAAALTLGVLGLAFSTGAVAAAPQTILPGYWSSTNRTTFIVSKVTEDKRCITSAQVASYITGPTNRHYHCTYDHRDVGKNTVTLSGVCVDKGGISYDVRVDGEYGPEWFKLRAHFSLSGLPIGGVATTEAHRLSAICPADAPGSEKKAAAPPPQPRPDDRAATPAP